MGVCADGNFAISAGAVATVLVSLKLAAGCGPAAAKCFGFQVYARQGLEGLGFRFSSGVWLVL